MTSPAVSLALIAVLGVGSQWLAGRLKIPSILLLLLSGVLAGPVFKWVEPDELFGELLFPGISLGVGILLFEGGLALRREEAAEVGGPLLRLITIGALATWVIGGITVDLLFDIDRSSAWLIAAVLVVSGPTVVLPLLRLVNVRPTSASLLKWEGILIDPIGALLAVVVLEAVLGADSTGDIVQRIVLTLVVGGVIGVIAAVLLAEALGRHWVPDRLHNAVVFMSVVVAFVAADQIQGEAGLTATTLMGVWLANQNRAPVAHIAEFEEDLGVLVLGALFIVLGARVDLDAVVEVLPRSMALLAVLVFIARPVAVWLSMVGTGVPNRDRLFVSAMAPRGIVAAAVASLFALELEEHGDPVPEFVPIIFTVIVGTVIVYSLTCRFTARRLRVARATANGMCLIGGRPWVLDIAERLTDLEVPTLVVTSDDDEVMEAAMRGLLVYAGRLDSEDFLEAAQGSGVGAAIALSESDDFNDLAIIRLREVVGRANVFELPGNDDVETTSGTSKAVIGRRPFGPEVTRDSIEETVRSGSTVRRLSRSPVAATPWVPLLIVDGDGMPRVANDNAALEASDHVIGLLGPQLARRRRLRY